MAEACKEVNINGTMYMRGDLAGAARPNLDGKPYVIVRTFSAGCFAGYLSEQSPDGKRVKLLECRRLWKWTGAMTLQCLATTGTSSPATCKFPVAVMWQEVTECIEVIGCTECGRLSIQQVPIWRA